MGVLFVFVGFQALVHCLGPISRVWQQSHRLCSIKTNTSQSCERRLVTAVILLCCGKDWPTSGRNFSAHLCNQRHPGGATKVSKVGGMPRSHTQASPVGGVLAILRVDILLWIESPIVTEAKGRTATVAGHFGLPLSVSYGSQLRCKLVVPGTPSAHPFVLSYH